MSNTNSVEMKYMEEVTFGVIPAPSRTMRTVRFTGESLKQGTQTVTSQEIRADRQIVDVIRTGIGVEGDLNFELSPGSAGTQGAHDDFILASLQASSWPADVVDSETFAVGSSTTITKAAYDFAAAGFVVGNWFKASGFVNAANNVFMRVAAVAVGTLTISGPTLVVEAGVAAVLTMNVGASNGVTQKSFLFEKGFTDVASEFEYSHGIVFGGFNLSVAADAVISGAFSVIGKSQTSGTVTLAGTTTAAVSTDVLNGIDNVQALFEGGLAAANIISINEFSLQVANNLRTRNVIGTLGAESVGSGSCEVSGTLKAYFTSKTLLDKYLNFTKSSLSLIIKSSTNTGYIIDLPSVKYTSGERLAGGLNDDVMTDLAFTAYRDSTLLYTIRVTRFTN